MPIEGNSKDLNRTPKRISRWLPQLMMLALEQQLKDWPQKS